MVKCTQCGKDFDTTSGSKCPYCGNYYVPPIPPQVRRTVDRSSREGPSYERGRGLFDIGAVFSTIREVLLEPESTFKTMKREGGLTNPFVFAILLGTVFSFISALWAQMFSWGLFSHLGDYAYPFRFSTGFSLLWILASTVVAATLFLFLLSLILHGCLHLAGGANQPFETTFRVVAYVTGATSIFQIFPLFGGFISTVWALVCGIIGIKEAHGISTGKAALAVFLPFALCCGCGLLMLFLFGSMAFLGGWLSGMH